MSPEDMWRWIFYSVPNSVKVERALKEPAQLVADLKKEIQEINQELLESKSQQIAAMENLNRQISKKTQEYDILQKTFKEVNRQVKTLNTEIDKKNSVIKQKDELIVALKNNKPTEIEEKLLLKQLKIFQNYPAIYFNGKLSLGASGANYSNHYCEFKVRSFFNPDENISVTLRVGEPIVFKINGRKHTIHLLDIKKSYPDGYILVDIYPLDAD
jgi:hypothetical protein